MKARCEKCRTTFEAPAFIYPTKIPYIGGKFTKCKELPAQQTGLCVTCPVCGRRYFQNQNRRWFADRALTVLRLDWVDAEEHRNNFNALGFCIHQTDFGIMRMVRTNDAFQYSFNKSKIIVPCFYHKIIKGMETVSGECTEEQIKCVLDFHNLVFCGGKK